MVFELEDEAIVAQLQSKRKPLQLRLGEPIVTFSLRIEEQLNEILIEKANECNLSKQSYIHQLLVKAVKRDTTM